MTSKFEYIELSSLISEKPRNGLYKKKEFQGKGHRWIKMSEVYGNDFLLAQQTELLDVTESEISRFNCQAGDLLFGRTSLTLDGIGDCLLVGDVDDVPIFESNLFRVRFDGSKAYPLFYFYFFKSIVGKQLIQTIAKQTAATSITSTDFVSLSVPYAPLDRQKEIGDFLFLFDKKCEFNTQTNQTLEEMAQAIFKSWFVDFDPVKAKMNGEQPEGMDAATASLFPEKLVESELGLIPEGWEVSQLSDICKNHSQSYNLKSADEVVFVNTGDVQEGDFLHKNYSPVVGLPGQAKKAIKEDDILYSEIRPKNKRFAYVDFDVSDYVVSTKFMVIQANEKVHPRLLYMILTRQNTIDEFNIIADSRSGTFPQITFKAISNLEFCMAPREIQDAFVSQIMPMIKLQSSLKSENKQLAEMRDTLLPKLLSGEIELG